MGTQEGFVVHAIRELRANQRQIEYQQFPASSKGEAMLRMREYLAKQGCDPNEWSITAHTQAEAKTCQDVSCGGKSLT